MDGSNAEPVLEAGLAPAKGWKGIWASVRDHRLPWTALGLTTLLWLVVATRWRAGAYTVPWDSKNQFFAFFRFLGRSFHDGTSILWNPYHYGGHPSIADPQSPVFWPQFLLWAALDPAPTLETFDMFVLAHLLLGGLALVLIGWRRGWPPPACILAAVVFMLGGPAMGRLNHVGITVCYGLFPVAVLLLDLALERRSLLLGAVFAVIASMIAIGRNQVALMLCLLLVALAVRHVLNAAVPRDYLRQRAGVLALMAGLGACLVAVPVALTLQLAANSNRPAETLATALEASLHPANLASAAVAQVFGALSEQPGYWGPGETTVPEVKSTDDSFNYLFVGWVPVVLLAWLGVAAGRLPESSRRTWMWALVAATLFSLGRYTPLFPLIFQYVPGFDFFRRPIDGVFVMVVLVAVLSGDLLASFMHRGRSGFRPLATTLAGIAGIAILAAALAVSARTGHALDSGLAIARALPTGLLVIALLWWGHRPDRRAVAAWGLAAIASAELLAFNVATRLNAEDAAYYRILEAPSGKDVQPLRELEAELARRHLEGARPRVEIIGLGGPWQNLAMTRRIEATGGYNPLRIGIYDRFVAPGEASATMEDRPFPATFNGYGCPLAQALGLEYLMLDRPLEMLPPARRPASATLLLGGPNVWLYRIRGPLPRVSFQSRIEIAHAEQLDGRGHLLHRPGPDRALIDVATPPSPALVQASRLGPFLEPSGTARIRQWRPDSVAIDVEAARAGIVVLHDTFYPGWTADVDGAPVAVLRTDVLFRGVEVPAGRHRVTFRYRPFALASLGALLHRPAKGRRVRR